MFEKWFNKDKDKETTGVSKVKHLKTKDTDAPTETEGSNTESSSKEKSVRSADKKNKESQKNSKVSGILSPKDAIEQGVGLGREIKQKSSLRVDEEALQAGVRAKAMLAAMMHDETRAISINIPEGMGIRGEAAALFGHHHYDKAIDVLIGHLNKEGGKVDQRIWLMLMDMYQIQGMQNHFEKTARLFASVFKSSPPSWESLDSQEEDLPSESSILGRQVLIVEGFPAKLNPEKRKDFVVAARTHKSARLDLSRSRLNEDASERLADLNVLLDIMRKLRQFRVSVLLMGENQLVEYLRMMVQDQESVAGESIYWMTLLEFLQWRGQREAFEKLAIIFASRFGQSAPEFESEGVIAVAPRERRESVEIQERQKQYWLPEKIVDESVEQMLEKIQQKIFLGESIDFVWSNVKECSYESALLLNQGLVDMGQARHQLNFVGVSDVFVSLFEITGIVDLVPVKIKKR